ncbi:MAG: hypothetical protein ACI9W4_000858 [Rhodothermales bacterium]|jgi:hypothetical protein
MSEPQAIATVSGAIAEIERWVRAIEARGARKIRRSELIEIQQECLTKLAAVRFAAPLGSDFRTLMSNIALVSSREARDAMVEQWLTAFRAFLTKQLRARDPFNWKGESRVHLYGLEMALPRKDWPYGFNDK